MIPLEKLKSNVQKYMGTINTALIGFGLSGSTFHAPFIKALPQYNLSTVVSSNPEKVLKQLPNAKVIPTLEDALADPEIKLIIITTPNVYHFEHAKKALLAGKDVVVDKPFTVTSSQAQSLIELAKKNNCILTVYHNRRWDGDFLTVQDILRKNLLGEVYHYESHFHRYRPNVNTARWKEDNSVGSGTLYDLGSHLIDQALLLFGTPDDIVADILPQRPGAVATDYFHLTLKYGDKRVILKSSSLVPHGEPKYILHGTQGSYLKSGIDSQEVDHEDGLLVTYENEQKKVKTYPTLLGDYAQFYKDLARSIFSRTTPPVNPLEALEVIKLIEKVI